MLNMLIGCMHARVLTVGKGSLSCVCAKKGEFGEIGRSEAAWPELCLKFNSDDAILMQNAVHWFGQVLHLAMFWAAQHFFKYAHKLELAGLYTIRCLKNYKNTKSKIWYPYGFLRSLTLLKMECYGFRVGCMHVSRTNVFFNNNFNINTTNGNTQTHTHYLNTVTHTLQIHTHLWHFNAR